jgi:hypothetical protein
VVLRIAAMKANDSTRIDLNRINRVIGSFDVQSSWQRSIGWKSSLEGGDRWRSDRWSRSP